MALTGPGRSSQDGSRGLTYFWFSPWSLSVTGRILPQEGRDHLAGFLQVAHADQGVKTPWSRSHLRPPGGRAWAQTGGDWRKGKVTGM